MIEHPDIDRIQRRFQPPRHLLISGRGFGVATGVLVHENNTAAMDYALSLWHKQDDGYDDIDDDRYNYGITFAGDVLLGKSGELTLRAGYSRSEYETGGGVPVSTPDAGDSNRQLGFRKFPAIDNYQTLEWRQPIGADSEFAFKFSHNKFDYQDRGFTIGGLLPDATLQIRYDFKEERYNGEATFTKIASDRFRFVTGAGYHYEEIKGPHFFNSNDKIGNSVYRVFGHGEYRPSDKLVVNFGAMLEKAEISDQDWLFLPRLSAHYHLNDRHTMFDFVILRDLSLADFPASVTDTLPAWGRSIFSFETHYDEKRKQSAKQRGACFVLWSGATRKTIAEILTTIHGKFQLTNTSAQTPLVLDSERR